MEEYITSGQAWEDGGRELEAFCVTMMPTISTISSYLKMLYGHWPLNWSTIDY